MKKMAKALTLGVLLLATSTVRADPILDFSVSTQSSGSPLVSSAGGSSSLIGSNLTVDHVTGSQTPSQNGNTLAFAPPGQLNFQTGGETSFTPGGSGGLPTWTFAPGGTISITAPGSFSGLLLSGVFNTVTTVIETSNGFKFAGGGILSTVDNGLAAFYGLPQNTPYKGAINLLFTSTNGANDSFTSNQISSGDVGVSPVPEPAGLAIGAVGVLGLLVGGFCVRKHEPVLC